MSTLIRHLNTVRPEEFDKYLAHGWRATGQAVYNCNFLKVESGEMISVLPMRLALKGYRFGKSLRKIMNRNRRNFTVVYGPARLMDDEIYDVNTAYLKSQPGKTLDNLDYHVTGNYNRRVLNTWETRVYDGQQLIAFSYFDLGQRSAYGKAGIYDPAYGQHSLGLFTMCLEIEFCQRRGLAHYYPGYVSDEDPLFDYKHRLGQMDFFDVFSQKWMPYGQFEERQQPLAIVKGKLNQAQQYLNENILLASELNYYTHMDARYSSFGRSEYLDVPVFVLLKQITEVRYHILTFVPEINSYQVLRVKESQYGLSEGSHSADGTRRFSYALIVEKILLEEEEAKAITQKYTSSYCI